MTTPIDVQVYFNFRSPYCYVASKGMFDMFDDYHANLVWKPLAGWTGRSAPDRAKVKIPLVRQDLRRITARMGIPMNPPPITTEPTPAGAVSLLAEERGVLREYIVAMMAAEWAEGQDIGEADVICNVCAPLGIDADDVRAAITNQAYLDQMAANWEEAQEIGLFGVPSFVIGEERFWGSDRIDYVEEYLHSLRLARL